MEETRDGADAAGAPVGADEREEVLDALRGVSLFGVLLVNLLTTFRVSLFAQFLPGAAPPSDMDRLLTEVLAIGIEAKAFILFSFLFGVGLGAQQERAARSGRPFAPYIARRLGFLLAVGIVHLFFVWNGDILTLYALAGFLAAPLLRLRTGALVGLALALAVAHLLPIPFPPPFHDLASLRAHVDEANHVYARGTFHQIALFRIREVRPIAALLLWIFPRTLALFLLGACAWRSRILSRRSPLSSRVLGALTLLALGVGGWASWAAATRVPFAASMGAVVHGWGPIVLAFGYAGLVILLHRSPLGARILRAVAPLGRMALTNYLAQSVVLSVLFYGCGLGLFGTLDIAHAALLGVAIYAFQAVASTMWLRHFRFGPTEWVWRSFTYGARPAMRIGA